MVSLEYMSLLWWLAYFDPCQPTVPLILILLLPLQYNKSNRLVQDNSVLYILIPAINNITTLFFFFQATIAVNF